MIDSDATPQLPADTGPWRVFIGHTGELAKLPTPDASYVRRAVDAVLRADHQPVEMAYFPNFHVTADGIIRERMATCQVYVGLIGFRWGSANAADPSRSYTEAEYDLADSLGLSRHLFLLDEGSPDLGATLEQLGVGDDGWEHQQAFRARVRQRIVKKVGSPIELELEIARSLGDITTAVLRQRPARTLTPESGRALDTWRRKREFLNDELAKAADPGIRFSTMEAIAEAEAMIAKLQAER